MAALAEVVVALALSLSVEAVKAVSAGVVEVPMTLAALHPKEVLEVTVVAADLVALPTA
jgi:hypothetical protein